MSIADLEERQKAIDTTQSFIVQAPAGSGKTELLTQRLLGLLATAERYPEEVLAITFTKKAAAEMKQRIMQSLVVAKTIPQPVDEPGATNWRLARSVLKRDETEGWGILNNPHRLRIQTIDGLCSSISRQMPITARLGAQPQIKDDCHDEYHLAAKATLQAAYEPMDWTASVEVLLVHMDNDLNRLETLLASLLVQREQWLPHIIPYCSDSAVLRDHLEQALLKIIEDLLLQAVEYIEGGSDNGEILTAKIISLAKFAAAKLSLKSNDKPSAIINCIDLDEFLSSDALDLHLWLGIVELLTTKEKTRTKRWRKATPRGVTAKIGFPTGKEFQLQKTEMIALLEDLEQHHSPLLTIFEQIALLPPPIYGEEQWHVVEALLQVLPIAVAQLNIAFQQEGVVDYSEVSQSALHALGATDDPSELALKLDYQIRHVLVDEFQDTSMTQFRLLEKLTAGWQKDDGRTLFIVGDPMQSIYRFREADVSLFLRARRFGVGDVKLESLVLQSNFRSNQSIVHWVNEVFQSVFPTKENLTTGAVTYSSSIAARPEESLDESVHYGVALDATVQVEQVIDYVENLRLTATGESIAVLVRAKSHVLPIAEGLRERVIPYQAVEIESLGHAPYIQDLLSLTKAMLHLGDRIAWLSLLRGPFCGLDLSDLLVVSDYKLGVSLWDNLVNTSSESLFSSLSLSVEGSQRIARLTDVLSRAFSNRGRGHLRDWVESTWMALGGLVFVEDTQLDDVEQFFVLLEKMDEGGRIGDLDLLERKMATLFAGVLPAEGNPVQIMTIHKSKGLEFDTVILPSIEKRGRVNESTLLAWCRQDIADDDWLLLSPIKQAGSVAEPIYQYIRHLDSEKEKWELVRLFYVAATRAKKRLGLFATVNFDQAKGEIKAAASGSLQSYVEQPIAELAQRLIVELQQGGNQPDLSDDSATIGGQFTRGHEKQRQDKRQDKQRQEGQRLVLDLPYSELFNANPIGKVQQLSLVNDRARVAAQTQEQNRNPFERSPEADDEVQRLLGVFVHQLFEQLSYQGFESTIPQPRTADWITERVERRWTTQLKTMGMTATQAVMAVPYAKKAVSHWLANKKLQILTEQNKDCGGPNASPINCEYELSSKHEGQFRKVILDRLFVDELGNHWVVDYKVVMEEARIGPAVERYTPQLEEYARLVAVKSNRKGSINCALYFPITDDWYEWQYLG